MGEIHRIGEAPDPNIEILNLLDELREEAEAGRLKAVAIATVGANAISSRFSPPEDAIVAQQLLAALHVTQRDAANMFFPGT